MADKPVAKKPAAPATNTGPAKSIAAKPLAVAKAVAPVAPPKPAIVAKALAPIPAASKPVAAVIAPAKTEVTKIESPKVEAPKVQAPIVEAPKPIAAAIEEGKKTMTDTFTKAQETAKTFAADASARATEVFGDVTARTKSALEKGSKNLEEIVEFSKGNLEAVVASGRVAAKGAQDIAKYSAEYGRKAIEDGNATAKKFAAVKSPTEFFQLQSEVAKKNLDAVVAEASKFTESYLKLLGEIAQPIQNRYAVAVEKVKTTVAA